MMNENGATQAAAQQVGMPALFASPVSIVGGGFCLALALQSAADAAFIDRRVPDRQAADLLARIEREWPVGIKRGANSNVVSVILPVRYLTDEHLGILATVRTLESLTISCRPELGQPSESGIAALEQLPQLTTLTLQCCGQLPQGVLEGVAKLSHLQRLTLLKASPAEPNRYALLTNLVDLKQLEITFPTRFGAEEACAVASLRQLKDLSVRSEHLNQVACLPLMEHPGLTNLCLNGGDWSLQLKRRHQ